MSRLPLERYKNKTKHLGIQLNNRSDSGAEVQARIATCMSILKKLDLFWLHAQCSVARKTQVYDAVIKAKLLYGLETTQLTPGFKEKYTSFKQRSHNKYGL